MSIAKAQDVTIVRDKHLVAIVIHGAGTLHMPPDTAHNIARRIMEVVGEIERDQRKPS